MDYMKRRAEHTPIHIDGAVVEQVESFKILGVRITNKLSWSKHTKTVVKRVRQCLFPLRRLKLFVMGSQILKKFYSCIIESILPGMATALHLTVRHYRWLVRKTQYITGDKLPDIQDLYTRRCQRMARTKNCPRLQSPKS
jgi:hypothetical protein